MLSRSVVTTHIIILGQSEHPPDLSGPLGSQPLGVNGIRHTGQFLLALLDDAQGQNTEVHADNATPDTLPLALSRPPRPVAAVPVGEQQPNTCWVHNSLLHGKTLLVVAAGDAEDVSLELVADAVAGDFLAHAAVHEDAEAALIFDFDELLRAVRRHGDVELHLGRLAMWW